MKKLCRTKVVTPGRSGGDTKPDFVYFCVIFKGKHRQKIGNAYGNDGKHFGKHVEVVVKV